MRDYLFIAVGLMIAALGAVPVMQLVAADPDPIKDGTATSTDVPSIQPPDASADATLNSPTDRNVGGLSDSVSRVLELRGSATNPTLTEITVALPEAVARLLIERNAVLVIPEPATP